MIDDTEDIFPRRVERMERIVEAVQTKELTKEEIITRVDIISEENRSEFTEPIKELMKRGIIRKEVNLDSDGNQINTYKVIPQNLEDLPSQYQKNLEKITKYLKENDMLDEVKNGKIKIHREDILPLLKKNEENPLIDEGITTNLPEEDLENHEINRFHWEELNNLIAKLTERTSSTNIRPNSQGELIVEFSGNLISLTVLPNKQKFLKEFMRRKDVDKEDEEIFLHKRLSEDKECPSCGKTIEEGDEGYFYEINFKESKLICLDCRKKESIIDGLDTDKI